MDYKDYLEQGIKETNEGKFDDALHSLNRAIGIKQDDPIAYFSLAIVFHNMHETKAAFENYTKAIVLDPKMCDAYYNRAQVILMNKEADNEELHQAFEDLTSAIELDPKFIDALYYKAVVQKKLEDYKGAVETLEKVLAIDPQAIYSKALLILIKQKYLK
jgi:tetratricopeptide (TPR) repeat protein